MNPFAVLALPGAALVLAGTTLSTAPAPSLVATRPPSVPPAASVAPPVAELSAPAGSVAPVVGSPAPGAGEGGQRPVPAARWGWPLRPSSAVVRPFVRPATRYGVGHRGVDLAGAAGQEVLAVDDGTVTHVGTIAGRGTVSVLHPSGIRSTYEPMVWTVVPGSVVARGTVLGRLQDTGSHCAPAACLHLGAVRGDVYLDPMTFLQGGQRVRLLPLAAG